MMFMAFKVLFSGAVIAFCAWLSGKRPELAGFLIALPLMTLLVLPFSHAQYHDAATTVKFAQSIFLGVPLSLLFFVPFLLAARLPFGFWGLYASGLALLTIGYCAHRAIMATFFN